jgi:hypothetical protein
VFGGAFGERTEVCSEVLCMGELLGKNRSLFAQRSGKAGGGHDDTVLMYRRRIGRGICPRE